MATAARERLTGTLSVAMIDDHEIVALAVEAVVAGLDGLEYVGARSTVDELLTSGPAPDNVVLDLRLADGSVPAENVERLVEAGARVLVFTSGENPYLIRSVARSPIQGLVRKSAPPQVLAEALRNAACGTPDLSPELASAIDMDPGLDQAGLSAQEQRVLTLFAQGLKAESVAHKLGISPHTVWDYVKRVRAKYEGIGRPARDKLDLYQRAVEDGFLPSPSRG